MPRWTCSRAPSTPPRPASKPRAARPWLGSAAHYAFSATAGACYGVAAPENATLRAGFGTLYGVLVWLVADEMVVPALRLSKPPRDVPPAIHLYSLAGHCVFGAALHAALEVRL